MNFAPCATASLHCPSVITAPAPTSMFDHVYATPHAAVEDDRAFFAEYESGFADGGAR